MQHFLQAVHPFARVLLAATFIGCALGQTPVAAQRPGQAPRAWLWNGPELPYCSSEKGTAQRSPARAALCSFGYTIVPAGSGALMLHGGLPLVEGDRSALASVLGYSLVGIGGPLLVGGLLFGPSVGSFYARDRRSARIGLGVRAAGGAVLGLTPFLALAATVASFGESDLVSRVFYTGMYVGGALVAGGALFNFAAAPFAARRSGNARARLSAVPRFDRAGGGLTIRVSF